VFSGRNANEVDFRIRLAGLYGEFLIVDQGHIGIIIGVKEDDPAGRGHFSFREAGLM